MIAIIDLPLEILLGITDYVGEEISMGSVSFASTNRSLSNLLLPKVRRTVIRMDHWKWRSDERKTRLLQSINDPYNQLSITSNKIEETLQALSDFGSFYSLTINHEMSDSILSTLTNSQSFQVKYLSLQKATNIESFNLVIPNLESLFLKSCKKLTITELSLPTYPRLRSLKLYYCYSVEDVSCLDGIHDLELYCCVNVTDISCLNHNYRVSIGFCRQVITYSTAFRYTRSLKIIEDRPNITVDLGICFHLKSLAIHNTMGITNLPVNTLFTLQLDRIVQFTSLPPNRLQKVTISKCPNFSSFDNMGKIRSIHLEELDEITTLTGLGPNNQNITLVRMFELQDISSLKDARVITIRKCPTVQLPLIGDSLSSVVELELHQEPENHESFLKHLSSLKQLNNKLIHLKVLKLYLYPRSFWVEFEASERLRFLLFNTFKTVETIELSGDWRFMVNEKIKEQFHVIITCGKGYTVKLLRK